MNALLCYTPQPRSSLCLPSTSAFVRRVCLDSYKKRRRVPCKSLILDTIKGATSEELPSESVTRRLILLRHAESLWKDRSLHDHERPLSKAGQADAINVALKLQKLCWIPELILCSNAVRTRETLAIMQQQVKGLVEAAVHFIPSFYSIAAMDGQTAQHLQDIICQFSRDDVLTVMCMGHNKGWEEAASMLTGTSIELETCNAALLEAVGKSWDEAFALAGVGGWKLHGIVKPNANGILESFAPT